MGTYIEFVDQGIPIGKRTRQWSIRLKAGVGDEIGVISWYGPWRKYCFYSAAFIVFEEVCLREIARFVEDKTREHRAASKAA